MWGRNDFEDGYDNVTFKTGSSSSSPGWVTGCDSTWQPTSSAPGNSNRGRRHSTASDSGDTGIGTSCSDSVEDHSSSSTTPSFQPLRPGGGIPTAHVMPSPSPSSASKVSGPSPLGGGGGGGGLGGSPWGSSCQLPPPCPLDMKDPHPVRRWSSLTRLSAPQDKPCPSGGRAGTGGYRCDPHGSLDRGLLYGYRQEPLGGAETYLPASQGLLLRSPGADPRYHRYDPARCGLGGPLKPSSLDLSYSALPESRGPGPGSAGGLAGVPPGQRGLPLGHQAPGGSPIQPAVRTQMWLSEQMEYRPGPELGGGGGSTRAAGQEAVAVAAAVGGALSAWQQEQQHRERLRQEAELSQMLAATSLPVNTLVKIKEGLLRQRELEIDRQKQQILQLHARIRENELRAQQVLHNQRGRCEENYILKTTKDSPYDSPLTSSPLTPPQQVSDRPLCCEGGELGRKLAAAELEVVHLNDFLKLNTQKYGEDVKKLEEKMKTRDRYISSLKKKCQRESEQNQDKQQRIETLEKYLADLPSLDQVQTQAQQLEETQKKAEGLQEQVCHLGRSLEEGRSLLQEKEELIESQGRREKELMAAVHSLQAKVEQCLEDGVRLPMMDLKQLEAENGRLLEQQESSSKLIANQKKQIERLTVELTAAERRCQQERGVSEELQSQLLEKEEDLSSLSITLQQNQRQLGEGVLVRPATQGQASEAGPLLREMSLCLLDLQALCSILTQRAQGQEPNLALLLGIKSMSVSGEDNDNVLLEEGLRTKLSEAAQLRKDIDALRTAISDRYAQDMGDNCVTQ